MSSGFSRMREAAFHVYLPTFQAMAMAVIPAFRLALEAAIAREAYFLKMRALGFTQAEAEHLLRITPLDADGIYREAALGNITPDRGAG